MDSRNYRDLQEAYYEVYGDLNELNMRGTGGLPAKVADATVSAAKWIAKGPQRHSQAVAQHKENKRQKKIPYAALTAEEFDAVLSYLVNEGYVDSIESAEVMVEAMSDEWLGEILDEGVLSGIKRRVKKALKPGPLPPLDTHISVTAKPEDRHVALQRAMRASKNR